MRILALDSSGLVATVAIVEDEQTVAEYTVNYKKTHSQTLLPMLDEIVKMTVFDLNTIFSMFCLSILVFPKNPLVAPVSPLVVFNVLYTIIFVSLLLF